LPLPAPKPVDALRQHTRAVVLISAEGDASPPLLDAIRDSEIPCELIGHPVVAMAELVRLEQDNRRGDERTALFVADDERIEQLSSLFHSVRNRLPQVAIWVIAGEIAVQVQRATAAEAARPEPPRVEPFRAGPAARAVPQLRIVDSPAAAPIPQTRTIEPKPETRSDTRLASTAQSAASDDGDARIDPDATHSTKLTAEELDMLLGFGDEGPTDDRTGRGARR